MSEHGRELDAKVAEAMGKFFPQSIYPPDPCSTDAACLPEMLAHLHQQVGNVTISTWPGGAKADAPNVDHRPCEATTLQAAVANLVVAVAEARKR